MSVNASFVADFSKFDAAVKNATVELTTFDAGATKAEAALQRMANQFTGVKVVQQATLMAEAIERVGGVSSLTATELTRVGRNADEAAAKLVAIGQKVPPEIQKVTDAYHQLQDTQARARTEQEAGGGFLANFTEEAAATAAGMLSAQAAMRALEETWRTLTDFVKESVHAYADAQAADVKMVQAMKTQGTATTENIEQYRELAATYQTTTIYSDDLIQKMEALFTQVGDIGPEQMNKALKASTDLASGLGIDLESATMLVAKAAAGHTTTLARYGVTVDQAELKSKGFEAVLEAINKQFGGQAAAAVDTFAGKTAQIANSWNNVQEAVGKALTQSPIMVKTLDDAAKSMVTLDHTTNEAAGTLSGFARVTEGETIGVLVQLLEYLQDLDNEIDRATERLKRMKPPDLFAGGDPNDPRGRFKAYADEMEPWMKSYDEVRHKSEITGMSTADLQKAVDDLNGSVAEGITYYKELGVSVESLATYYGVSETQVRQVVELQDRTKKIAEETAKWHDKAIELEHAITGVTAGLMGMSKEAQDASQKGFDLFSKLSTEAEKYRATQLEKQGLVPAATAYGLPAAKAAGMAPVSKELAEDPLVKFTARMNQLDTELAEFARVSKDAYAVEELRTLRTSQATDEFTASLGAASKANHDWIMSLTPKGGGMFGGGESILPWSTLGAKPITVKPIGVGYKEIAEAERAQPAVTVNVSGVWDPATVSQMTDRISGELLRRTGRQLGSA